MKRILVIGGGSIGERHVRCFLRTNRTSVALCELNGKLRENLSAKYPLTSRFASLDDALKESFDAAVVCTPAHLHVPMAQQIAEHDIAVLIEKPLSVETDGIDQLINTAASRHLAVSVAYTLRQHPALQAVRETIRSGRFGRPVQVVFTGGQHFPFYRPAYREIYYNRHATGGGAIQDALTHVVNAMEWIVGPVTRLAVDAEHCVLDGVDVEDTVHMIARHASVLGSYCLNQYQPPSETTMTVVCEDGAARFEMHNHRWLSCQNADAPWTVVQQFTLERDDLFTSQANAFLDQLEKGAAPACSLEEARQTLMVNRAALESARTRQWIDIPLKQEQMK